MKVKLSRTTVMAIGILLAISCLWIPYIVSPWFGVASLIIGIAVVVYGWRFMRG
jgi:heme O synthase-like polyprenyltransferase